MTVSCQNFWRLVSAPHLLHARKRACLGSGVLARRNRHCEPRLGGRGKLREAIHNAGKIGKRLDRHAGLRPPRDDALRAFSAAINGPCISRKALLWLMRAW